MLPSLHRVGVLANPADPFTKPFLEQVQLAGRVSGIDIGAIAMGGSADEVDAAFADMVRARARKPSSFRVSSFSKRSRILRSIITYRLRQSCARLRKRAASSPMARTPLTSFGAAPRSCTRFSRA